MGTARTRVVVRGRVQGVFFRTEATARARSLGLTGWVTNLPDGTVEAIFEGRQEAVESMLGWCSHGPAGARVDDVAVTWEEPRGDKGFEIR